MSEPPPTRIFLVGFMGAGKTTVGKVLARRLDYEFVDLDDVIEAQAGKSVRAIFSELGEPEFRRLEGEAILSCGAISGTVVALGGGAYLNESNRLAVREMGMTFWLDCPLEVCMSRLGSDPSRPLLGSEADMRALLERRIASYVLADYLVATGNADPGEVAEAIMKVIGVDRLP